MNSIAMMSKVLRTYTSECLEEMMNNYWPQLLIDTVIIAKGFLSTFETIF